MRRLSIDSWMLSLGWVLWIWLLAPGAAALRPILKHPLGYWPSLVAGAVLSAYLLRSLLDLWKAALQRNRRRTFCGTGLLAVWVLIEFGLRVRIPVERFHFLLFGVLGVLLAGRCGPGWKGMLQAWLLCGTVAAVDELLQALLASRVGDPLDLLLDLEASGIGIAFLRLCQPEKSLGTGNAGLASPHRDQPPAMRGCRIWLAAALLTGSLTWLLSEAWWGHTITMPGGTFFSAYSEARLLKLSATRNYLVHPPATSDQLLAWKDRYFIEGIATLKDRNDWVQQGLPRLALFDNAVLETYYSPVLDAKVGRWSPAMLQNLRQQAAGASPLAPTHASTGPARPPWLAGGLMLTAVLAFAAFRAYRRVPR